MKDVMLDIESLGNGKHAAIVQVGAAYFDRVTGAIGNTFKINIDARSAVESGAELDADTVYWWLSQSREAIDSITEGPLARIDLAMGELNSFLRDATAMWSHIPYDWVIITETFKRLQMRTSFHYRTARDIRTLVDLAGIETAKFHLQREGIHHDALADCFHQIKYCVAAFQKLGPAKPLEHRL